MENSNIFPINEELTFQIMQILAEDDSEPRLGRSRVIPVQVEDDDVSRGTSPLPEYEYLYSLEPSYSPAQLSDDEETYEINGEVAFRIMEILAEEPSEDEALDQPPDYEVIYGPPPPYSPPPTYEESLQNESGDNEILRRLELIHAGIEMVPDEDIADPMVVDIRRVELILQQLHEDNSPPEEQVTDKVADDPTDAPPETCVACDNMPCVMFGCGHCTYCRTCIKKLELVTSVSRDQTTINCPICRDSRPYRVGRWIWTEE